MLTEILLGLTSIGGGLAYIIKKYIQNINNRASYDEDDSSFTPTFSPSPVQNRLIERSVGFGNEEHDSQSLSHPSDFDIALN